MKLFLIKKYNYIFSLKKWSFFDTILYSNYEKYKNIKNKKNNFYCAIKIYFVSLHCKNEITKYNK